MSTNSMVHQPVDAVTDRLNDPTVAASLVLLLDNAEMLATLVSGLNGFLERGDTIIDSVASSVREIKDARTASGSDFDLGKTVADLKSAAATLNEALPSINQLVRSGMLNADTIDLLGLVSESAVAGRRAAQANDTTVKGVRGAMKALKDPDVQRGAGLLIEIARALGKRVDDASSHRPTGVTTNKS